MIHPRFRMHLQRAVIVGSVAIAGGLGLTACSIPTNGGLESSCSSYNNMSSSDQLHLASEWANPMHNGKTTTLSDAIAPEDRTRLQAYCEEPGHGSDHIGDLEETFGP